jgi:hypothetical protein
MGEKLRDSLAAYEAARFNAKVQINVEDAQKEITYRTELGGSINGWKQTRSYTPDRYVNSSLPRLSSFIKR